MEPDSGAEDPSSDIFTFTLAQSNASFIAGSEQSDCTAPSIRS